MRIFKYPLGGGGVHYVSMPVGAQLLSLHPQDGRPCIWALVDEDQPAEQRMFHVLCTGDRYDERHNGRFVGTCLFNDGSFVLHVFELT